MKRKPFSIRNGLQLDKRSLTQVNTVTSNNIDVADGNFHTVNTAVLASKPIEFSNIVTNNTYVTSLTMAVTGANVTTTWDLMRSDLFTANQYLAHGYYGNVAIISFKNDGTQMFIGHREENNLSSFDLSSAWDLSTATFNSQVALSANSASGGLRSLVFSTSGDKFFYVDNNSGNLVQYGLSEAWNISTLAVEEIKTINSITGLSTVVPQFSAITFDTSGSNLYLSDDSTGAILYCDLSTAYDISTATRRDANSFRFGSYVLYSHSIQFSPTGNTLFLYGEKPATFKQLYLEENWNVASAKDSYIALVANGASYGQAVIADSGTKLFITDTAAPQSITQHDLNIEGLNRVLWPSNVKWGSDYVSSYSNTSPFNVDYPASTLEGQTDVYVLLKYPSVDNWFAKKVGRNMS